MSGKLFELGRLSAVVSLTLIVLKYFGQPLGVQVDPDGLAASAIYPLAIIGALLVGGAWQFGRRSLDVEANNA